MTRAIRFATMCLCALMVTLMVGWGMLSIYYSNISGETTRTTLAVFFFIATLSAFIFLPRRLRTLAGFIAVFFCILVWWLTIPASNHRTWQADVRILPYTTTKENLLTLHNIRNLQYRTETDFTVQYYDKTFDINQLTSVDLITVYWMGGAIAHVMMSFGFQEKDFVTFSIETRKEVGENYSTLKGFFKQYELVYVAGDERDLIRLRTDYRHPAEDVYLYRTAMSQDAMKSLFLEYSRQINALKEKPEWYNTLTTNCTTNIVRHFKTFGNLVHYNWKILLSGYAPQYAYEIGALDTTIPFEKLQQLSHINAKAVAIGSDANFSVKIREQLPRPGR